MLEVKHLKKHFRGLVAVDDISFGVLEKEILALIGPNGAGKTTVFNLITGVVKPTGGTVMFKGNNITGLPSHQIARHGICRTFQTIRLFDDLTVLENVLIGAQMGRESGFFPTMVSNKTFRDNEDNSVQYAKTVLESFGLIDVKNSIASSLPYGTQRVVEMARALAARPNLLLLDEPVAGMNREETVNLSRTIEHIRNEFNVTILLVEHDMKFVMGLSERIIVMSHGRIIAEGCPRAVRNNPSVIEAYLGTGIA